MRFRAKRRQDEISRNLWELGCMQMQKGLSRSRRGHMFTEKAVPPAPNIAVTWRNFVRIIWSTATAMDCQSVCDLPHTLLWRTRRIVELIKEGKGWADIARTLSKHGGAILYRCQDSLDPRLRFGPFTAVEDAAIHAHLSEHGEGLWAELSAKMGYTRNPKALQKRYRHTLRPDIKKGVWSDDERRRLLEGIVKYWRNWTAVAGHVGTGRTPCVCQITAKFALDPNCLSAVGWKRFTPDDDARLRIAVERHGRGDWDKVAEDVLGRSGSKLRMKYEQIIPQWMRVSYSPDVRASVRAFLRGDGNVESKLAAHFKDLDAAKGWDALELGMDEGSQVDWARVNGASGAERSAALDAVEKEIVPRVTTEEWKEGASAVWVPTWRWERPICAGRKAPIEAVANHPRIKGFVAVSGGNATSNIR